MTTEEVQALIAKAAEQTRGTHSHGDIIEQIAKGAMQLWVGEACIGVTEVTAFPRRTVVNVFLAAGDLAEFHKLQPGIEAFGRGRGATLFMFMGKVTKAMAKRCGWSRASTGCEPGWLMYTKDI